MDPDELFEKLTEQNSHHQAPSDDPTVSVRFNARQISLLMRLCLTYGGLTSLFTRNESSFECVSEISSILDAAIDRLPPKGHQ